MRGDPIGRREFVAGAVVVLVGASSAARAQAQKLVCAMIGAPSATDSNGSTWFNAIRLGLSEEGWLDGGNIHIEARYTAGLNSLSEQYSAELAALGPDVWLCGTPNNALNAHRVLPEVPLVFVAVPDPVGVGLVRSFNDPGGNVTGVAHFEAVIGGRHMQLLLAIAPHIRRVGFIYNPSNNDATYLLRPYALEVLEPAGIELIDLPIFSTEEVEPAIHSVAALPDSGLYLPSNNWVSSNRPVFLDSIRRNRIPAIWAHSRIDEALISYHGDTTESFHQGGRLAGLILGGADPALLPVLGVPRYVLTVNLRAAAELGLTVPTSILIMADRIIE